LPLQPKKNITTLKACTHGGLIFDELKTLGIDADKIIDFSISTNPFMPPPGFKETMKNVNIERYPDSYSTELTEKLAKRLKTTRANILVGSGTSELIRLISLAYFHQNDTVLILEPTYGEYEVACRVAGARPVKYRALEENSFIPDIQEFTGIIRKRHPRAVFICNPNNPTGKYLKRTAVENIIKLLGDTLMVLDEAYLPFVNNSWNSLDLTERNNVIVMRSMTKDYGLPGLRLGYAIAQTGIIESLRSVAPPWNVNAIAQAAGIAVLKKDEYLRRSLVKIQEAKNYLQNALSKLGFNLIPSDAHYFMVKVGNATECRRTLLKHDIMVRDCTSFGLPEYIRVSPRTMPECEQLVKAMKIIIDAGA
jgi:histidinol-phosphate aminotransferase